MYQNILRDGIKWHPWHTPEAEGREGGVSVQEAPEGHQQPGDLILRQPHAALMGRGECGRSVPWHCVRM